MLPRSVSAWVKPASCATARASGAGTSRSASATSRGGIRIAVLYPRHEDGTRAYTTGLLQGRSPSVVMVMQFEREERRGRGLPARRLRKGTRPNDHPNSQ